MVRRTCYLAARLHTSVRLLPRAGASDQSRLLTRHRPQYTLQMLVPACFNVAMTYLYDYVYPLAIANSIPDLQ